MEKGIYQLLEERMLPQMGLDELVRRVANQERRRFKMCLESALKLPTGMGEGRYLFTSCGFSEFVKEHYEENSFESFPLEEMRIEYTVDLGKSGKLECVTEKIFVPSPPLAYGLTFYRTEVDGKKIKDVVDSDIAKKVRALTNTEFTLTVKDYKVLRVIGSGDAIDMVRNK